MQTDHFNLQNSFRLLQQKWKLIFSFVLLALVIAIITLKLTPKYYRSSAILVPANVALADKAHLFNQNIEGLYSYFGNGDDLDRIYGIASMDTVYKQLVDEFNLIKYYRLRKQDTTLLRRKAVLYLKEDIILQKTELGQLKIIVWTKDKSLSANLVNRLVDITQNKEEAIWKNRYELTAAQLNQSVQSMERQYDSLSIDTHSNTAASRALKEAKMHNLLEQINTYQKSINEYKLALTSSTPSLYILERAVPAVKSEKPDWATVLLATAIFSLVFVCLTLLMLNRESSL